MVAAALPTSGDAALAVFRFGEAQRVPQDKEAYVTAGRHAMANAVRIGVASPWRTVLSGSAVGRGGRFGPPSKRF